jgi:hypothetical protein
LIALVVLCAIGLGTFAAVGASGVRRLGTKGAVASRVQQAR